MADDFLIGEVVDRLVEAPFFVPRIFWKDIHELFAIIWERTFQIRDVLGSFEIVREPACVVTNARVFPVDEAPRRVAAIDLDTSDVENERRVDPIEGVGDLELSRIFCGLGEFLRYDVPSFDCPVCKHDGGYECFANAFVLY